MEDGRPARQEVGLCRTGEDARPPHDRDVYDVEAKPMRTVAVIPARLASTRLPRKALREIAGKPLIGWVYDAVRSSPVARRRDHRHRFR